MGKVEALGYVGLTVTDMPAWRRFASDVLGLSVEDRDGTVRLRCDERAYRLELKAGDVDRVDHFGWEVRTRDGFHALVEHLRTSGCTVEVESAELAAARDVTELASIVDPDGQRVEIFHGQRIDSTPFVSPTGARFVTSGLGFGHGFKIVENLAESRAFYVDLLGFRVSDRIPIAGQDALFLRCNARHHSMGILALTDVPASTLHLMFETDDIDQVGRAYDLCLKGDETIAATLGRHSNDRMLSFYVRTPSGFDIEYGWGGLLIDEATWSETSCDVESFWGHDRGDADASAEGSQA